MFGRGFSTVTAGSSPTARNLLFHPIGSLPAEGPTSRVFRVVHESADENNTASDDVVGFCAMHPCAFPHEVKAPEANPETGEHDEKRFHGRDFTGRLAWRSNPLIARPRHLGFSPSRGRAALVLCHDPARHQRGLGFRHLHEPSAKGKPLRVRPSVTFSISDDKRNGSRWLCPFEVGDLLLGQLKPSVPGYARGGCFLIGGWLRSAQSRRRGSGRFGRAGLVW